MPLHREAFMEAPTQIKLLPKCPECDKTFSDNSCVKRHMQNIHMKATTELSFNFKKSRCPVCDKTFSDNYGMKRHMKVHEKNKDMPSEKVVCKVCDKVFNSEKNMYEHLKIHKDKTSKNDCGIDVGEKSAMGENHDVVCDSPFVRRAPVGVVNIMRAEGRDS